LPDTLDDHPLRATRGDRPRRTSPSTLLAAAAAAIGTALLFVGYWGASDTSSPGEQIPYLASATVPGLALVIGGAVLTLRREHERDRDEVRALTVRFDALLDWLAQGAPTSNQVEAPLAPGGPTTVGDS
jgi:hypothetical protein